jgi:hypothetical protein
MAIRIPHNVKPPANIERKAEAFIGAANKAPAGDAGKVVVNMRFDGALLQRIDAAAKRQGISRTAWLHVAAANALE